MTDNQAFSQALSFISTTHGEVQLVGKKIGLLFRLGAISGQCYKEHQNMTQKVLYQMSNITLPSIAQIEEILKDLK